MRECFKQFIKKKPPANDRGLTILRRRLISCDDRNGS